MKHIVDIHKERSDCSVRSILYPYMESIYTMRFCRKVSRSNMVCVGEIKANRLHHSPDHDMEE